jgi:hypothetical protein
MATTNVNKEVRYRFMSGWTMSKDDLRNFMLTLCGIIGNATMFIGAEHMENDLYYYTGHLFGQKKSEDSLYTASEIVEIAKAFAKSSSIETIWEIVRPKSN